MSGGALPSLAPHICSPPEAPGRSETCWHHIREKGLVRGSALPLKCCPWRFGSCSRLLVHQLFNSLQPCGLQPQVLASSERTSPWHGGVGLGRGMRSRGWAEDPCWEATWSHGGQVPPAKVLGTFSPSHPLAGGVGSSSNLLGYPRQITSLLRASLSPPVKWGQRFHNRCELRWHPPPTAAAQNTGVQDGVLQ